MRRIRITRSTDILEMYGIIITLSRATVSFSALLQMTQIISTYIFGSNTPD